MTSESSPLPDTLPDTPAIRPRRSVLYMPGSNARALDKARTLGADALILDLEDAVAPEAKDTARRLACEAVRAGGYGRREMVIRVNARETPWFADDLRAAVEASPDAILLPKIETVAALSAIMGEVRALGAKPQLRLWAMIETPLAILNAGALAAVARASSPGLLAAFVMGTNDLAKETGARQVAGRAPMLAWLSHCVAAARAHGLAIIDGVYNSLSDEAGFRSECEQGRDFGFDGKTLIHPGQLATCNAVFSPADAEVAFARRIIVAFALPENAGKGALQIDGRMVERLHAQMAARTVAMAEAIGVG